MGLVEHFLENISIKTLPLYGLAVLVVYIIYGRIDAHIRVKRLGNYGRVLSAWAPWSLDFVYKAVKATWAQKNLELWRDDLFLDCPSYTSEATALGQRVVFTANPENIKALLATQFSDYGKGKMFHDDFKPFLGDSIFTTDGHQWHTSRQLIRPQFTRDRVSDLHCFEEHMQTLFRAIANGGPLNGADQKVDLDGGDGKVFDVSDLFFRYTLDVTTDFLLGTNIQSLSTLKNGFAESFNEVQRVQNIIARVAKLKYVYPKKTYWDGIKVINNFINPFIERTLRLSDEELAQKTKSDMSYTFLHELASFTRDPKVIRDQIVAILLAGRDTTASTLSWIIYELGRNPRAVEKLRAEILDTIGRERTPTYEHVKNMPYLKAVINETLRIYPVVPFNVRFALKDTTLPFGGGPDGSEPLPILGGDPVAYSPLVMQRRPDLYPPISDTFPDPVVFSPERWAHWHPKPHYYIPFNAGPRICIGQQFALTEMSYVLCRLFQKYDRVVNHMGPIDGGDPVLKSEIVLSPGQGVKVAFYQPKE